jgi:pimeloyl-ACP methyl ester carboxylesterase
MVVVYLHGFGNSQPWQDSIAAELGARVPELLVRSYHPHGDWRQTRLPEFLEELRAEASERPFTSIVGFSVGGLIAALFQDRWPELVERVVLLAPAIDNYERNFQHVPQAKWFMPPSYVTELEKLPARPALKVPTLLIHRKRDTDDMGSALWRILEWAETESFERVFYPDAGHSMYIVGRDSPGWDALATWALTGDLNGMRTGTSHVHVQWSSEVEEAGVGAALTRKADTTGRASEVGRSQSS